MIDALIAVAAVVAISLGFMLWIVLSVPEGWQDESGFHYGREPGEGDQ